MDEQALPSLLGDFARILRSHGIATVFHAGKIDPIDGGTAAGSLRAAVEEGRRERLTPECQARVVGEISGALFDATEGFDTVKKARVVFGLAPGFFEKYAHEAFQAVTYPD
ncbi:hypothetical protein LJ656_32755 [Paraburkholderia sp. MMS20-SJTR3]|uniref:Uncharacterized protein n=1 Tax=Paraburkholderia sejongensis TaxID=2886946 RepID=A0ABS8K5B2_9BURK|nr:hypothetical protein [Paraburkholderia sp. MMS20-SJTR3]MCC8397345.1 hypothetical protein [Paraburkholderia sp. MMS20-SJTR3]